MKERSSRWENEHGDQIAPNGSQDQGALSQVGDPEDIKGVFFLGSESGLRLRRKADKNGWMLLNLLPLENKPKLSYLFQETVRHLPAVDPGCPQQLLLGLVLPALGQEPASRLWEVPGRDLQVTDTTHSDQLHWHMCPDL